VIWQKPPPYLCNNFTNWTQFQNHINNNINLNLRLKQTQDLEDAVEYITQLLQAAAWTSTPHRERTVQDAHNVPQHIKELVGKKRRARRRWQTSRNPSDKTELNRLTHNLRAAIIQAKNETFKTYITNLSPTDHSLWKATKKLRRPTVAIPPIRQRDGSWARTNKDKTNLFAKHLATVFTPHNGSTANEDEVESFIAAPCQLSLPTRVFTPTEIRKTINTLSSHKAPGYDLITGALLKHLPRKAIVFITTLYNGILRLCHIPVQWKYAQIIMIPKPGKPPTDIQSYRPISLLPLLSKVFERLLLTRLQETLTTDTLPTHQFGFRAHHSTIQQCHRIVNEIKESIEGRKVCTSVFLDIHQAFDKVWHKGLLYKLKKNLPDQLYLILKSYLTERYFQVRIEDELSDYHLAQAGVPQGSVLGPLLYLIFTADVPLTDNTLIATFADDTAIMSSDHDPAVATHKLQLHLNLIQNWMDRWKIAINPTKSAQVTFTTRKAICPQVSINNSPVPIKEEIKYLGLHLDKQLTWRKHIKAKSRQLALKLRTMGWLMDRTSQLSLENKITIYKTILKPIWTYGIELWGCSKPSNTKILQTFQSKTLRKIANAPWYVSNHTLHNDFNIPYITEVIRASARKHNNRIAQSDNPLIRNLLNPPLTARRLQRTWPEDLSR
jgi:hypothetical protein